MVKRGQQAEIRITQAFLLIFIGIGKKIPSEMVKVAHLYALPYRHIIALPPIFNHITANEG